MQIIYDRFIADDRIDVTMANVGSKLKKRMDCLFGPRADDEKTQSLSIEKKKEWFTTDHETVYHSVTEFIERYNFYESELFKNALYDKKTKRFGKVVRYEMRSEYVEASTDRNNWSEPWLQLHNEDGYDSDSLAPSSSKDKQSESKPQNRNKNPGTQSTAAPENELDEMGLIMRDLTYKRNPAKKSNKSNTISSK